MFHLFCQFGLNTFFFFFKTRNKILEAFNVEAFTVFVYDFPGLKEVKFKCVHIMKQHFCKTFTFDIFSKDTYTYPDFCGIKSKMVPSIAPSCELLHFVLAKRTTLA